MKRQKLISLILCFSLLMTSVAVVAYAQTQATVYSQGVTVVSAGDTVRIPVRISDNPGIMGFKLSFGYDSDLMTPISVEYGDIISGGLQDNIEGDAVPGSFNVYWSAGENMTGNGIMFYINMEIKPSAVGNAVIDVTFSQADTFDEDFNDVVFNCSPIEFGIANNNYSGYAKITTAAQNVTAGSAFDVTVHVSELTTEEGIDFILGYDSTAFEYLSYNCTAVTGVEDRDGTLLVASVPEESDIGTDFITLTFRCRDNAKSGSYSFTATSDDSSIFCKGCSNTVYASAVSDIAVITAEDAVGVAGETVEIPVSVSNNHGLMGYKLRFGYDAAVLEPVSLTASSITGGLTEDNIGIYSGHFDVLWQDNAQFETDGVLFTVTFNVLANSYGTTQVDISYYQADTFNEKYEDVVLECHPATVMESVETGDIDLDGDMDADDYDLFIAYIGGEAQLNSVQLRAADLDGDGSADAFDLFALNKQLFMTAEPDTFDYTVINATTARVTSYTGSNANVTVPSQIDGYNITSVYNYTFKNMAFIKSVTVSAGIKTIGYGAFLNCSSLESVELPTGLTSIGTYAFKDCGSLTRVVIPASVSSINANSFTNCNTVTIYGYAGSYAQTYANNNGISFVAIG